MKTQPLKHQLEEMKVSHRDGSAHWLGSCLTVTQGVTDSLRSDFKLD